MEAMMTYLRKKRLTRVGAAKAEMLQLESRTLFSAMPAPSDLVATTEDAATLSVASAAGSENSQPQVALTWRDNSTDETAFQIFRALDGGNFWNVAVCDADSTTFVDLNVAGGYTYHYQVRAVNGENVS